MTIIVVDDDALIRLFVAEILHDMNIDVEPLDSAEALMARLEDSSQTFPELIILDVILPGIDGFEAASRAKALFGERHLPIIFLTGYREPDVLSRCLSVGDDYIPKPFSVEMVTAKVRAHQRVTQLYQQLDSQFQELRRYHNQVSLEHEIVESMFRRHIEENFIDTPCLRFHTSPTSLFNGDVLLFAHGPIGNLYILIGDVTGHGLPAAVGAIPIFPTFFAMARKGISVGAIAAELNRALSRMLPDHMMMAATLLELHSSGDQITVWSGGLPPALIVTAQGSVRQEIEPAHCPLAMLAEEEFSQDIRVYTVEPGDRVYLFTDGVEESRNIDGNFYGEERLRAHFEGRGGDIYARIIDDLAHFTRGTDQDDDITLVELTCLPAEESAVAASEADSSGLLPWSLNLDLNADDIKKGSSVSQIVRLMSNAAGVNVHQDYISTILSELISNAVEHGILQLDSSLKDSEDGFIEYYSLRKQRLEALSDARLIVSVTFKPESDGSYVLIDIKDSGSGFDSALLSQRDLDDTHGRGVTILRELCDSIEYSEEGTRVKALYRL